MNNIAFTAPHGLASEAGLAVLKKGGNAVDAMVAAAAMIAVQYPHMNSLGGDGFWLIQQEGKAPVAIDACGYSAAASSDYYSKYQSIPERGPQATLCMAGTVNGWLRAREVIAEDYVLADLTDLFKPSIDACKNGVTVTESLQAAIDKCLSDFSELDAWKALYAPNGQPLRAGDTFSNLGLARLLGDLAEKGLDAFYRGDIAATLATALADVGSPLSPSDFHEYNAKVVDALQIDISKGRLFNLPEPTQGIASLLILALYDRLHKEELTETEFVHLLVEATKQAFIVRDNEVADSSRLSEQWPNLLDASAIESMAESVDPDKATAWPRSSSLGDTIWMGAVDQYGTMVSFIQSIYWEFGSGVVIPEYGLVWNNRGVGFSLDANHRNYLAPRIKPFHTLNPALAVLADGRRMVYGTMGGEGQPQTQAALFTRAIYQGVDLPQAIAASRWLLGRTWGDSATDLKIESSLYKAIGAELLALGHDVTEVPDLSESMGHAGAIILQENGVALAATDPRSDGLALVTSM